MNETSHLTIDNTTGAIEAYTPHVRYRCKLTTAKQIRQEMAKVYRQTRSGIIDSQTAAKLTWCLASIHTVVKTSNIEERLLMLEKGDT